MAKILGLGQNLKKFGQNLKINKSCGSKITKVLVKISMIFDKISGSQILRGFGQNLKSFSQQLKGLGQNLKGFGQNIKRFVFKI